MGKKILKAISFPDDVVSGIEELARYRSAVGGKNRKGQPIGFGTIINEAARIYLEDHKRELMEWRDIFSNINALTRE